MVLGNPPNLHFLNFWRWKLQILSVKWHMTSCSSSQSVLSPLARSEFALHMETVLEYQWWLRTSPMNPFRGGSKLRFDDVHTKKITLTESKVTFRENLWEKIRSNHVVYLAEKNNSYSQTFSIEFYYKKLWSIFGHFESFWVVISFFYFF